MNCIKRSSPIPQRQARLSGTGLAALSTWLFENAAIADASGLLPEAILTDPRAIIVATAPFDYLDNGSGLLHSTNATLFSDTLRALGAGDLSLARIFEGHFNAVDLVARYGVAEQLNLLKFAARSGSLSGVWGANGRSPLRASRCAEGWRFTGGKILASGAGVLTHPLVTAETDEGQLLFMLDLPRSYPVDLTGWTPLGMRSSQTGSVDLSGMVVGAKHQVGRSNDFMRQPYFSGGAWRFCAAHVGAMERLVDLYRAHLVERGREGDPYQLERVATAVVAVRTARFWVERCAVLVSAGSCAADAVAFANLTRVVTERAGLDVMALVQRGVGLAAVVSPNAIERICRDLSTYLRQPVPDLAMADGARTVLGSQLPMSDLWGDHAG